MDNSACPLGQALGSIEGSILPALSGLLDGLLDTAALAQPGIDADQYATALRFAAIQVEALTELVESVGHPAQPFDAPLRISA
ncbi:hypothetical protein [Sphingosinicella terrae]|uniref:hypothetical protein n=1 Tax=Sphingosinicella terrae TaxID=2172047 RepID=UPI000E0D12A5|nr:hypothetical protein [Sphingosinicella terrae]